MSTRVKILFIIVAVVCFAVSLSYPIIFQLNESTNNANNARLAAMREAGRQTAEATLEAEATDAPDARNTAFPAREGIADRRRMRSSVPDATHEPLMTAVPDTTDVPDTQGEEAFPPGEGVADRRRMRSPSPEPTLTPSPSPSPTPDRRIRTGALAYPEKEHVVFDEANILPEFCEMYELNHDLIGWINIPGTLIDFPVVQSEDSEYYLTHDFFGEKNKNGQIILEERCDPFTPSYNLVISGHNMYNDSMFSPLIKFRRKDYWQEHPTLTFDVLTERRSYVIFAAFFSGVYEEGEEGFRYNADIQYRMDVEKWLAQIRENQVYDTGIDVAFGDEFLTLTTCNHFYRKNGRFVVVCRRIREGEVF